MNQGEPASLQVVSCPYDLDMGLAAGVEEDIVYHSICCCDSFLRVY
jgi:hypothetical protein